LHELSEERPLAVHFIESFGLLARQMGHPERNNVKTSFLDALEDGAARALLDGVRLDDAEGAFDGHVLASLVGPRF
jgi:hypothetical protein